MLLDVRPLAGPAAAAGSGHELRRLPGAGGAHRAQPAGHALSYIDSAAPPQRRRAAPYPSGEADARPTPDTSVLVDRRQRGERRAAAGPVRRAGRRVPGHHRHRGHAAGLARRARHRPPGGPSSASPTRCRAPSAADPLPCAADRPAPGRPALRAARAAPPGTVARRAPAAGDAADRARGADGRPGRGAPWELAAAAANAGRLSADDPGGCSSASPAAAWTGRAARPRRRDRQPRADPARHHHAGDRSRRSPGRPCWPGPVTGDVAADGTVTDSLPSASTACASTRSPACTAAVPATWSTPPGWPPTARLVADLRRRRDRSAAARRRHARSWRMGGGLAGELPGAEITTLLGAVNGVRKIAGVGAAVGRRRPGGPAADAPGRGGPDPGPGPGRGAAATSPTWR